MTNAKTATDGGRPGESQPQGNAEEVVRAALEPHIKSEAKRDKAADAVVDALEAAGHLYENGWVTAVEVHHARVAIEAVEAYGLTITLDANAVSVSSPSGFMIIEVP